MANDETSKVDEQLLHRLVDGDLSAREREALEREMTEQDRARANGIRRVGDLIRLASDEASSKLDSRKLLADIEDGISAKEEAGFGEAFRVIEGGGGTESSDKPSQQPSSEGTDGAVRPEGWKVVIPVTTGLLAAAVVLLVVLSGQREVEPAIGERAERVETVIETPAGNEVLDVDLGENAGTVFAVQGDAGEPLAVIWIEEDDVANAEPKQEEGSSI